MANGKLETNAIATSPDDARCKRTVILEQ